MARLYGAWRWVQANVQAVPEMNWLSPKRKVLMFMILNAQEEVPPPGESPESAHKASVHFPPVVAPILRERRLGLILISVLLVLAVSYRLGLSLWHCPIKLATGLPCPGCGLTRGGIAALNGDFSKAVELHPFSPVAVLFLMALSVLLVVPIKSRQAFAEKLGDIERKTGIVFLPLVLCVIYGVIRMVVSGYQAFGL